MAVGFVSVLLSIAGAAFMVTFMTLYGRPLLQAVGTSAGFGPLIAIPGVIGYVWAGWELPGTPPLSLGYVSLLGAAVIIPASFLAVPWGVKVAHGISKRRLESSRSRRSSPSSWPGSSSTCSAEREGSRRLVTRAMLAATGGRCRAEPGNCVGTCGAPG